MKIGPLLASLLLLFASQSFASDPLEGDAPAEQSARPVSVDANESLSLADPLVNTLASDPAPSALPPTEPNHMDAPKLQQEHAIDRAMIETDDPIASPPNSVPKAEPEILVIPATTATIDLDPISTDTPAVPLHPESALKVDSSTITSSLPPVQTPTTPSTALAKETPSNPLPPPVPAVLVEDDEELELGAEWVVKLDLPPLMPFVQTQEEDISSGVDSLSLSSSSSSVSVGSSVIASSAAADSSKPSALLSNSNSGIVSGGSESSRGGESVVASSVDPTVSAYTRVSDVVSSSTTASASTQTDDPHPMDGKILENIMARAVEEAKESVDAVKDAEESLRVDPTANDGASESGGLNTPGSLAPSSSSLSFSVANSSSSSALESIQPVQSPTNDSTSPASETTPTVSVSAIPSIPTSLSSATPDSVKPPRTPTKPSPKLINSEQSTPIPTIAALPINNANDLTNSTTVHPTLTTPILVSKLSTSAIRPNAPPEMKPTAITPPPPAKAKKPLSPTTADSLSKKPSKKEERFNHASFDCGSLILGSNPGASSTTAILVKSKDQYMLNKCEPGNAHTPNFVIVELCDTIKIDTLMMANYEYFSSTFKDVRVSVAEQYPPKAATAGKGDKGWMLLGRFVAANVRDAQYFKVKDPLIFTRYLKIEFLSHYGTEYYCPMTQLKVFGKTEMEEFREEEESLVASLAKEDEAMQEAIRSVAIRAVQEIDAVAACSGDACTGLTVGAGEVVGWMESMENVIFPKRANPIALEEAGVTSEGSATKGAGQGGDAMASSFWDSAVSPADSSHVLSPDYFRLFMESQDQSPTAAVSTSPASASSPTAEDHAPQTTLDHPLPPPPPPPPTHSGTSQESIFKTISKRLALLERNSTLSYQFIEEQSRAYHAAFVRVEMARQEAIKKALGECNRTMTRVVRDLAKDYEAAWSLLLRDLERQRRISDSRMKDVERSVEKLGERMNRQIFYEFVMVILLVLLLTRIFTPSPIPTLSLDTFSPIGTPRTFRKHISPYFSRYISAVPAASATSPQPPTAPGQQDGQILVEALDPLAFPGVHPDPPRTPSIRVSSRLQTFATLSEEDDESLAGFDAASRISGAGMGDEEVLSSPDASLYPEYGDGYHPLLDDEDVMDGNEEVGEESAGEEDLYLNGVVPETDSEFHPAQEEELLPGIMSPVRNLSPLPMLGLVVDGKLPLERIKRGEGRVQSEPTTPTGSLHERFPMPG
ncbi:hypothetical protein HDU98_000803 [Podochytrium sp. JEL0797]|nr:hypothetical protein HDU98_000803 [Podochytrium sp. JEL0797]